jgi:hypothetical protein
LTNTIVTDSPLDVNEREILRLLAGMIVPASQKYNIPGADDPLIFADILDSARAIDEQIRESIGFAIDCGLGDGLSPAELRPTLEGQIQMAPLVSLVMQCYYRDDRVMISLDMEPRPPYPRGYDVPNGDWSMLEAVQRRGKIWRDA